MSSFKPPKDLPNPRLEALLRKYASSAVPGTSDANARWFASAHQWTILLLSGAFNPVHLGHVLTLDHARRSLLKQHVPVIGGLLAPSSDSYVKGKLGTDALPLSFRVALCDDICAHLVDGAVVPYGNASGTMTAQWATAQCQRILEALRREAAASRRPFFAPPGGVVCVPLYGSDFLVKYPRVCAEPFVILARRDAEGTAEMATQILEASRRSCHPDFRYLTDVDVPDVSSTKIRLLLSRICSQNEAPAASSPDDSRPAEGAVAAADDDVASCRAELDRYLGNEVASSMLRYVSGKP